MDIEKERCPICWLDFSSYLHPHITSCGHSYCKDCYVGLKTCAVCRLRLASRPVNPKNYSLLSLVEKLERTVKDRKEQYTQTDDAPQAGAVVLHNPRMPHLASQPPLNVNFVKDDIGNIQGITFTFM